MAATETEVKLVIDTDLVTDQINQMLLSAENILVAHIDPLADPRVTAAVRDDMKIWLAAHFVAIRDRRVKEESADGIRTIFEGKVGLGLDVTIYGQQVKMIDPTGKIAEIGAPGRKRLAFHFSEPRDEALDP